MATTLREYLVALGFKVDENGWKGFNSKLGQSAKNVAALGQQTIATATAIGVAVEQVARHYEELYYVSQRTGQSASFIKSAEFGLRQIGVSGDAARASIEAMGTAMRTNPGLAALAKGMGVKDPIELVEKLKNSGTAYFVAARQAAMFGMDEQTFAHVWANVEKLRREQDASKARMTNAGLDPDKMASQSMEFMTQFRGLMDEVETFEDKTIATVIGPATSVVHVLRDVMSGVNNMNKELGGTIGILANLAGAWGAAKIGLGVLARFGILGGVLRGGASLGLGGAALGAAAPVAAFAWAMGAGGTAEGGTLPTAGGPAANDNSAAALAYRSQLTGSSGSARDMAVRYFMSQGWSREQALGMAANLQRESGFDPKSVGDGGQAYGLAQWHPDRQTDFARWAGKDIRDSSMQEQLAFMHYELTGGKERRAGDALRGTKSARDSAGVVSRMYERPANVLGESSARGALAQNWSDTVLRGGGGGDITIAPKTEINISGVSDPKKAASLVGAENDRTNGNITRWGKSAIQ